MTSTNAQNGLRAGSTGRRLLAPALLATAVAGCATLPPPAPAAHMTAPTELQSAQALAAPAAAWPQADWWRAYNDPQLDALIEEALAHSPTLAQAEARLRAANAVRETRTGIAGVQAIGNASVAEVEQSQNAGIPAAFIPSNFVDFGRATLDFSYEIDFWGRNRAGIAAAASQARAAQADAAQARLTLSTAVGAAYADLARLYAERAIVERSITVRSETVALVRRRVVAGVDNLGQQRQAEAGVPAARAELAAVDESIAQVRNRLAALVGAGPDRGLAIAAPARASLPAFGLPETLSADLIGRRPDLVAARWRAEAATHSIREARALFYPNVNLSAYVGTTSLGLDLLTDQASRIGSIGPAVSLPLFRSHRLRGNLARTEAERDIAVDVYNATLTEALHEVADVAASERALATRLRETRAALAANEEAYRIARARYEGGLAPYQTVLTAEDALLAQRRALAILESRSFVLDVALVRALGGGFAQQ